MTKPQAIFLHDYKPSAYLINKVDLTFTLGEETTLVQSRLEMVKNKALPVVASELKLNGEELTLVSVKLDGDELEPNNYNATDQHLIINNTPDQFTLEIVTEIKPQENTKLTGLYKSNNIFCTQCEAHGFRRITYYLDRPDVMSIFTTKIIADKNAYPVLLSNGNCIEKGELDNNQHFAVWQDPFKKPAYLFALVAGDLASRDDTFTTCSGREIKCQIFVDKNDLNKTAHAMDCLKQAMRWDEEVYGREYDLDIFMIVAVSDFTFGAMENKGLNIFNSKYILADPATATDSDYEAITTVVAHEYFHNWSGNRVTCRDWFQLSLKEGFTVFRDQEHTGDMYSKAVARIDNVNILRNHQFIEDAGPMAHPVRPASYVEINNFYTATVYNKGAEVIRMIRCLLGPEKFRQGSDLYFKRFDGQAVTCDDFVQAMQDASGVDLSQFKLWYSQAGTPVLTVDDAYDSNKQEYHLTIKQHCPPTPDKIKKQPMHIPVKIGLLDSDGQDIKIPTSVLELTQAEQTFTFNNINTKPTPSLGRGFSAPVKINYNYSDDALQFLLAHDSDGFNRWEAAYQLAVKQMMHLVAAQQNQQALTLPNDFIQAYKKVLADTDIDKQLLAQMLNLPSESYLAEQMTVVDVDAIHQVRQFVRTELAANLKHEFLELYHQNHDNKAYQFDLTAIGERRLKNTCLSYLAKLEDAEINTLCLNQFNQSDNMTDTIAALAILANSNSDDAQQALQSFFDKWQYEALVIDKWFAIQAGSERTDALEQVIKLSQHSAFNIKNPNKVYALVRTFCLTNHVNFHRIDGKGYAFLAEQVTELEKLNPMVAARVIQPLTYWKRYDKVRQVLMKEQLEALLALPDLSRDTYELVSKSLAS